MWKLLWRLYKNSMKTINETINQILGIKESYQAPKRLMEILFDEDMREKVFFEFLEAFSYRMDYDWFHTYFEDEHADRKVKKQDFTPMSVANLLNGIVDDNGMYFESCAGTGGICIAHWQQNRLKAHPLKYRPSNYLYVLEELSDRVIPFLIFNMAIRGINAAIIHCDSLTRECYEVYLVQNEKDLSLEFSNVYAMPKSERVEKYFNVKFARR